MANEQNLKPFKKGQSGNPKGRPKMPDLNSVLAEMLNDEKEGKSALQAIIAAQRAKAAKGDTKAAEFLFKWSFSLPKQYVENDVTVQTIKIIRE